jgi:alginate O-acetyltransferase complex protein AlgI
MVFSEWQFFPFFAVYLLLHLLIPARYRNYLIIVGGTVFYAWWRADYVWVPYTLTLLAFAGTAWMESADDAVSRKRRMAITVALLLAPLLVIKYTHLLAASLVPVLGLQIATPSLDGLLFGLPLGISFITFTVIAYVVDVFRKRFLPEKSLSVLLAYVLFFPHLVAGPILRPNELIPQLRQLRAALGARFLLGVSIFTLGLFKKLVIADQLAAVVEPVYRNPGAHSAFEYLLAIYGFSAQIYCDFSGYTDMAIGLAYILRIRLPTNFLRPYCATSIIEFWRRWHITLSHWLRDYLYIPLGGSRKGPSRRNLNLLVTMGLGGLWHGANWTFLTWGLLHGLALVLVHGISRRSLGIPRWLGVLLTFHFVAWTWIFFRAPDFATALRVATGPFTGSWHDVTTQMALNVFPLVLLAVFFATHRLDRHAWIRLGVSRLSWTLIVPVIVFCWIVALTVSQGNSAKFIYFDF